MELFVAGACASELAVQRIGVTVSPGLPHPNECPFSLTGPAQTPEPPSSGTGFVFTVVRLSQVQWLMRTAVRRCLTTKCRPFSARTQRIVLGLTFNFSGEPEPRLADISARISGHSHGRFPRKPDKGHQASVLRVPGNPGYASPTHQHASRSLLSRLPSHARLPDVYLPGLEDQLTELLKGPFFRVSFRLCLSNLLSFACLSLSSYR